MINDMMKTKEAEIILKAVEKFHIQNLEDIWQDIYLARENLGLSDNTSLDYIFWVIANNKAQGTECEGCAWVSDRWFTYQDHHLNHCNECGNNPKPVLRIKYEKVRAEQFEMFS